MTSMGTYEAVLMNAFRGIRSAVRLMVSMACLVDTVLLTLFFFVTRHNIVTYLLCGTTGAIIAGVFLERVSDRMTATITDAGIEKLRFW